jgi:hypothetical protein
MKKLVLPYDKCLNCGGDYVENEWDSSAIRTEQFLAVVAEPVATVRRLSVL